MGQNNRERGSFYEDIAVDYLQELGYQIIERNWHFSNRGEIDIIAVDPNRFGRSYLIFVEVKYRNESIKMSLHALSREKIRQLKWLAKAYLQAKKIKAHKTDISFDFIAIAPGKLEHLKNVV